MEFIKLSQEVVDISKKLESISKKLVKSIHTHDMTVLELKSPYSVKSNPSSMPAGIISHKQTSMRWEKSLRNRN